MSIDELQKIRKTEKIKKITKQNWTTKRTTNGNHQNTYFCAKDGCEKFTFSNKAAYKKHIKYQHK
jgi:hypothetical protein